MDNQPVFNDKSPQNDTKNAFSTSSDENLSPEAPAPLSEAEALQAELKAFLKDDPEPQMSMDFLADAPPASPDTNPKPLAERFDEFQTEYLNTQQASKPLAHTVHDLKQTLETQKQDFLKSVTPLFTEHTDATRPPELNETQLAQYDALLNTQVSLQKAQDNLEWLQIETDLRKQFPEITEDELTQAGALIEQALQHRPTLYTTLMTKQGKIQVGLEALESLGVFNRLKTQIQSQKQPSPSAPDAQLVSKKVKQIPVGFPSYKASQINAMSQAEFNKLPDDVVDRLLKGEYINDL